VPSFGHAVLVAAWLTVWALVTLAFLLHTLGQGGGARATLTLLGVDALDLLGSDLGHPSRTPTGHIFSVFAACVMPALTLLLVLAILLVRAHRQASQGSASP
jgi:hypothetical protein